METFTTLLSNITPLYVIIALGWVAGRFYDVDRQSLANLAIYIVVPIVSFYYVASLEFRAAYIALPIVVFLLFSAITILFFAIGKKAYLDKRANLLAMCAGAGNTGYFGLPIVILLFPVEWVGLYVFALSGGLMYEATVMYYIANRGNFSPLESVHRVLKFPVLYAILLGLFINLIGLKLPEQLNPYWEYLQGAYVVVGMMIIGCALSKVSKLVMSLKFISLVFIAKFLVFPVVALGLVMLDRHAIGLFEPEVHQLVMIMAIMPPAANITAFATQLNISPEKAATTVLAGTVFALFYIPLMLIVLGIN
ncbi:MAG: AEC family transporter [Pseudomonadota bacterium]